MALFDIFRLKTRQDQLEDRIRTLEKEVKSLSLEWSELYDKTRHALSRLAKREARSAEAQDAPGSTIDGQVAPDPITAAIWARRRRQAP